jgi:integrase
MSHFKTTKLSESSKKQFNTCITKWLTLTTKSLSELIADLPTALAALHGSTIKQSNANLHLYYSAVIAYITYEGSENDKKYLEAWTAIQKENSRPLTEHYTKNEPTAIQKGVELDFKEVVAMRDALPQGIERLLLGFYTHIDAMRADYYATRILKAGDAEPAETNYIQGDTLVVQDYKTKKAYGAIRTKIPEPLLSELRKSLEEQPRDYLFVKRDGKEPMTRNEFSGWANRILTRLFKKRTTLTAMRHSAATEGWKGTDIEAHRKKALSMGHSMNMNLGYVWK